MNGMPLWRIGVFLEIKAHSPERRALLRSNRSQERLLPCGTVVLVFEGKPEVFNNLSSVNQSAQSEQCHLPCDSLA